MKNASAVFFDFDGVLCTDRFYTALVQVYPLALSFINENIFGGPQKYADSWMRGKFSYQEINALISEATCIPFSKVTELFKTGIRQMRINPALIQFALSLKRRGIRIALVTNNMDIFDEITIPEKNLNDIFPVIINSFDYKLMKQDENGKLFDITLAKLGLDSFQGVYLIDYSPTYCTIFAAKGGNTYQYTGQKQFELWLEKSHLF